MKHPGIDKAEVQYEAAAQRLCDAVKRAFPIGTLLAVELGGHTVSIEVTAHRDTWWHDPGEMEGINIVTKKTRKFHTGDIEHVQYR